MAKFKQGEKVLRKDDGGFGEVVEVYSHKDFSVYRVEFGGVQQLFYEGQLEFAPKTFGLMVEFTDGKETVLRENNGGFDNMDEEYAAVIAEVNRYYGREDKPKGYTGKAVYVSTGLGFTRGKIYEFTDGYTVDDMGKKRPIDDAGDVTEEELDNWLGEEFVKVVV